MNPDLLATLQLLGLYVGGAFLFNLIVNIYARLSGDADIRLDFNDEDHVTVIVFWPFVLIIILAVAAFWALGAPFRWLGNNV